jgi:hypothetical protein
MSQENGELVVKLSPKAAPSDERASGRLRQVRWANGRAPRSACEGTGSGPDQRCYGGGELVAF